MSLHLFDSDLTHRQLDEPPSPTQVKVLSVVGGGGNRLEYLGSQQYSRYGATTFTAAGAREGECNSNLECLMKGSPADGRECED